jgi:hypothetical protein
MVVQIEGNKPKSHISPVTRRNYMKTDDIMGAHKNKSTFKETELNDKRFESPGPILPAYKSELHTIELKTKGQANKLNQSLDYFRQY